MYVDWKQLRLLLKWLSLTQSSLCPVVLANLGNQTVLCLFAMSRLNYNHFQTGVITTESWSQSVRGTRCPRTTSGTHTCCSFHQNGHSKSRFRIFKVVLNSTCTYYFLLDMAFYFYKSYSFPLQLILLPRLSTNSAFFRMAQPVLTSFLYSAPSAPELLQLYRTACSVTEVTRHKGYPTNDNDDCGLSSGGLLQSFLSTYT